MGNYANMSVDELTALVIANEGLLRKQCDEITKLHKEKTRTLSELIKIEEARDEKLAEEYESPN